MTDNDTSVIGLDIGSRRIGVARATWPDGLPAPLTTLTNDDSLLQQLKLLVAAERVVVIVVGRPRGMASQVTEQTRYVDNFTEKIRSEFKLPLYVYDEAGTSLKAEEELRSRSRPYTKADIDALSATYILEDFLAEHANGKGMPNEI